MKSDHPAITIQNLTVRYGSCTALSGIDCTIARGSLVAVVGPNGAGKSTLLKSIVGLVKPEQGTVTMHTDHHAVAPVAYVPQRSSVDWDFPATVLDVVLMGRYKHIGWFRWASKTDYAVARYALQQVKMQGFEDRPIGSLSGGQQQRVFLARALAQEASIYILDEPFVGIDKPSEQTIAALLKQLSAAGNTLIVVHHDLQTVRSYFEQILLINGKQIAFGPTDQVLQPTFIGATYGERNADLI